MLEARGITFGYPGADPLYRDFDLAIEPGERIAISAPSGFGKTTLARILAGFEQPQAGQVLCDGAPLPAYGVCPVQMVGQHPELAVDSRLRMVRTLSEAGPAALDAGLLDALGIRVDWLCRYPHELSGGELQRFCIARAVAVNPSYLVADEVTTMLDAVTQAQVWELLLDWQRRCDAGIVFVSHSPALTERIATRVVDLAVCEENERCGLSDFC